ncbi:MAG: hypothetical protein K6G85_06345 [Eubacterium sp.]|nr:hypothetical protein [Eubacterium sp.]
MTREEAILLLHDMKDTYDEIHENTNFEIGYEQMTALDMAINALKEQAEWKYVEKDGNPKEMGTYYCLVVAPSEYNGKTIPYYEYDTRWFGEGETAQAWKMEGQPDSGLVWTEQTGSMQGEQVYAWRKLSDDISNCLVDPQAFERLCKIK